MDAIRIIRRHLESDRLHLPELQPMIGKDVEIIVVEVASSNGAGTGTSRMRGPDDYPLRGSLLRDDADPYGPAVPPDAWDSYRVRASMRM